MNECVICLDDCNIDISEFRIDNCECKCKYYVHFECLSKYLESNRNKCLYCEKEIFSTNFKEEEDILVEEDTLIHVNINTEPDADYHSINDERESKFKLYISLIFALIMIVIIFCAFL